MRNNAFEVLPCARRALNGDVPAMVQRVTSKLWAMEKLELAELQRAASGM